MGVNRFQNKEEQLEIPILKIGKDAEQKQVQSLAKVKAERDQSKVDSCLERLKQAAEADRNVMPELIDCSRAYATVGEMVEVLRVVYGEYREPAFI